MVLRVLRGSKCARIGKYRLLGTSKVGRAWGVGVAEDGQQPKAAPAATGQAAGGSRRLSRWQGGGVLAKEGGGGVGVGKGCEWERRGLLRWKEGGRRERVAKGCQEGGGMGTAGSSR
jgi:hypothetical protein